MTAVVEYLYFYTYFMLICKTLNMHPVIILCKNVYRVVFVLLVTIKYATINLQHIDQVKSKTEWGRGSGPALFSIPDRYATMQFTLS